MSASASVGACLVCEGRLSGGFDKGRFHYARCTSCGSLGMSPQPSDEEIEGHYRAKFAGGNYELIRRFADEYRPVYRGFLSAVEAAFDADSGSGHPRRLLEIGCFTGEFLVLAAEAGWEVRGYELQEEAVAIAEARLPGRVTKTDVHDRNIDGSSFDAVCLFGVVEHVREPRRLIARAAELLRPGGCIFIQTPNSASLPSRLLGRYWPPVSPVEHINLLTEAGLKNILVDCGFEAANVARHVKRLPVEYVFEMMRHFGPELRRIAAPVYSLLPARARRASLPFYAGEMLVSARKR